MNDRPPAARESAIHNLQSAMVAALTTALLLAAIYFGSERLTYFDPALVGYCVATLVACFATTYHVVAFWQRRPSAFYGWALVRGLACPQQLLRLLRSAGRDLAAQQFIARRSRVRWAAHMSLAWGTLIGFAVTLPLVWGWLHFEAVGERSYRPVVLSVPLARFAIDGAFGWLIFHALHLAAVAVVLGATYFVIVRLRLRRQPGATEGFHLAPLLLLLAVALTGLALPAAHASPVGFRVAALIHEVTVIALLVALPYGKLIHLFIRPLHLGAQLVRTSAPGTCPRCSATMPPVVQIELIESLLAARGFRFHEHLQLCPACRRKQLAAVHTQLFGAQFQPQAAARRAPLRRAA